MDRIDEEIAFERNLQDEKWGVQNHPIIDPFALYPIPHADECRSKCDQAAHSGRISWVDIFVEEVAEAIDEGAKGDYAAMRIELIQVAAVVKAMIESLDRNELAGRKAG